VNKFFYLVLTDQVALLNEEDFRYAQKKYVVPPLWSDKPVLVLFMKIAATVSHLHRKDVGEGWSSRLAVAWGVGITGTMGSGLACFTLTDVAKIGADGEHGLKMWHNLMISAKFESVRSIFLNQSIFIEFSRFHLYISRNLGKQSWVLISPHLNS
jgi:hypothetical protein